MIDRYEVRRQARARHRAEGTPPWITGETLPSGCRQCSYARHEHGEGGRHQHAYEVPTDKDIKERLRSRRRARADWFRVRGFGGCAYCGKPDGRGEHATGGCYHPLFEGPEDARPYAESSDDQVLDRVPWWRSLRWRALDISPEEAEFEAEFDEGAPTTWELEPDPDYGKDLDEDDFIPEEAEFDDGELDPHDEFDMADD
ncbi:hypothetical protein [Nocardiopsis synnemataformans]|uniref:hypothetical protein n=1 Tax=Nocardiopsis synnemataformans TaxID=61305 RepID=UPI003EBAE2BB